MDKLKILDSTFASLEKQFGKEVVLDKDNYERIDRWELDSPYLNYILGGGVPKGRVIEIYGPESGGKSTLATLMAADIQRRGGYVAYIDSEHAFDYVYANKTLGLEISNDKFKVIQPQTGEDAFTIAEKLVNTNAVDFIIMDSVSAMIPKAEVEGNMGDSHMGLQARMMGQGLRKLTSVLARNKCTVIFINQIRMKIGCCHPDTKITWK